MIITSIERHAVYHARDEGLQAGFVQRACGKLRNINTNRDCHSVYAICRNLARKALDTIRPHVFAVSVPSAERPACNICGFRLRASREVIAEREARSCIGCGSTLRFRALMAALQTEMDEGREVRVLERIPGCKQLKGIGMTDTHIYAVALRRKFDYINTYFHTQPMLDIRHPAEQYLGKHDFVVSSDVLEHVDGPCERTLGNLRALLKPGGLLALTVPYGYHDVTIEHFPELNDYRIEGTGPDRILVNITKDGREQRFSDLSFHGGDGSTLELRIFSYPHLVRLLEEAGFVDVKLHDSQYPQWGIIHNSPLGLPITARAA
ncbi:class I SAM-dependent methyltransferase [Stenotrophomonas geniculata]|uniref:class I SAM-dependent methyltransferase n=1 Tax=Stenotrophomonas geniculata TaxID=86188 RepID=UPI000F84E40E|nr:methyltransferase domain-containing protein [Stenotrophomonas geniculata]RTY02026.1 class I SAM-dependent methyltransferase [Stenotrophomonas geniculata]